MKEYIKNILIFLGILTIVVFSWQILELIILGTINPNRVDSIIGSILTMSLYYNFKTWTDHKR